MEREGRNRKRAKFCDIETCTFFPLCLANSSLFISQPDKDLKQLRNNCGEWYYSCAPDSPIAWNMFVAFRGVVCLPHLSSLPLNASCRVTFAQVALIWYLFLIVGCEYSHLWLAHSSTATPDWIITVGFVLHADKDILVHMGEHRY